MPTTFVPLLLIPHFYINTTTTSFGVSDFFCNEIFLLKIPLEQIHQQLESSSEIFHVISFQTTWENSSHEFRCGFRSTTKSKCTTSSLSLPKISVRRVVHEVCALLCAYALGQESKNSSKLGLSSQSGLARV